MIRRLRALVCRLFEHDLLPANVQRRGSQIVIICARCGESVVWE